MTLSLFPEGMMKQSSSDMTLEGIASKLTYFHLQLHLIHWQTSSYAEHMALGSLYDYVHDFKDNVIEKLMGYMTKKPRSIKLIPLQDNATSSAVINELKSWAAELGTFARMNGYSDVDNMSQDLSGHAAQTLFLLTLS